ncbi:MAG TPA: hypothetical protein VFZ00_17280 [Solirubrobacter sp.]|nr:hypothetical protein [Solirubrobacter sp.]
MISSGTGKAGYIPWTDGKPVGADNEFALCLLTPGFGKQYAKIGVYVQ